MLSGLQAACLLGAVAAGIASLMQTTFNADLATELKTNGLLGPPISDLVSTTVSACIGTVMVGIIVLIRWAMGYCCVARASPAAAAAPAAASSSASEKPKHELQQAMRDPLFLDEKNKANLPADRENLESRSPNVAMIISCLTYATASVSGAAHITLKVVTSPVLGLGLDYLYAIIGQLCGSLLIDSFGLLGVQRVPPKPARFLAVALAFIGAAIIDMPSGDGSSAADASAAASTNTSETESGVFLSIPLASSLSLLAGVLHPLQAAVMQKILLRHPDPFQTSLISFAGSSFTLLVVALFLYLILGSGDVASTPHATVPSLGVYDYLGGLGGGSFIVLTVLLTPRLGLSVFFIGLVTGEIGACARAGAANRCNLHSHTRL